MKIDQFVPMRMLQASLMAMFTIMSVPSAAVDFNVRIINLTNGFFNTPYLVAAHDTNTSLFNVGEAASESLQAMAEGGDISGLVTDLEAVSATLAQNPAAGLLAPGASTNVDMNTDGTSNTQLSVVSMLLPTNDGFAGLNAVTIPEVAGTYVFNINAYDAGTEANDEIVNGGGAPGVPGIPADPGGNFGTGGTGAASVDFNTTVHIHRNNLGDTDPTGGVSDVDSRINRWLNPVVRVVVTVN